MAYGNLSIDSITTSTPQGVLGAGNASLMKNRIINGAMVVSQRNGSSSVTPANLAYTLDRWGCLLTQASKFTVQQNAGGISAPAGFFNYLGVTSSSAYSVASGDRFVIYQAIEGFNALDLNWGTANAKPLNLSFQVYSSLTGTFSGAVRTGSGTDYSYPFTYSIPVANTWTTITLNIPAQTLGTWDNSNGLWGYVAFSLGVGSTYSGTANTWQAGNFWGNSSSVNVVGTSGATFYITGVQLEVGSVNTGYEYEIYSQTLAKCQRYGLPVLGSFTGFSNGTTVIDCSMTFPVPMRTAPSAVSASATVASCVTAGGATSTQSSLSFTFPGSGVVSQYGASVRFSNFTGLTSGQAAYVYTNATTPAGFLSAEL